MTAETSADQPFTIVLDDDEQIVAEGRWRTIDAGPTWAKHRVAIRLDEPDTSGHLQDALSISVDLRFEDDVEGHALSLHFPSAEKAEQFRKRLIATGVVAGALVVGVTAAQLSGTAPATSVAVPAPVEAPAPVLAPAPAVNPRIPAEDLVPARPIPQPAVNPRIPAEDLVPARPIPQPAVNPRIPAEDLAPASGATAPATSESAAQRHLDEHH